MREVAMHAFTVVLVVFIISTMMSAGLRASRGAVAGAFGSRQMRVTVSLTLVVNLVIVPVLGVVVVNLFSMSTEGAIGLLLLASSPGAPFAVKLLLLRHGDVIVAAPLQLLLAVLGTVTFAATANGLLALAALDSMTVRLPVLPLMATVAVLQLTPFVVGLRTRSKSAALAHRVVGPTTATSSLAFVAAIVLALVAAGPRMAELPASVIAGAATFSALAGLVGALLAVGSASTRVATATLALMRATGPPFAAVAVAYGNDPAILGAITGEIVVILGMGVATSTVVSWAVRTHTPGASAPAVSS